MDWTNLKVDDYVLQEITDGNERAMRVIKTTPTFVWISPVESNTPGPSSYWIKIRRENGRAVGNSDKRRMSIFTKYANYKPVPKEYCAACNAEFHDEWGLCAVCGCCEQCCVCNEGEIDPWS